VADAAITVERLSKRYRIGRAQTARYKTMRETLAGAMSSIRAGGSAKPDVWALRDVTLDVDPGKVTGIIGPNGAGKTTLLKVLSRITDPTEGRATVRGRVGSLLEVGTGFHNELTGRENIYLNGAILGMRRREIERRFDEIVAFAEVGKFIDTPIKRYSSGMQTRLAFAVAAHMETEVLLVDEVLAVGDAAFQQRCMNKMGEVAREGRTILFVSHNMGAIRSLCDSACLLRMGRLERQGQTASVISAYYDTVNAKDAREDKSEDSGGEVLGRVSVESQGSATIHQGQPSTVTTDLYLAEPVSGLTLYCILEDKSGASMFCLRHDEMAGASEEISQGWYRVRVALPGLWLNPDVYYLYLKVFLLGPFGRGRHVSDRTPFDVSGDGSPITAFLHPQSHWSVERVT
jgi:lipopolysaccharide transport system ATP-binding protein